MFTIKAAFNDHFEIAADIAAVRKFFADIANFKQFMPGIEQIHLDSKGVAHWRVEAEVPVVGKMLQTFTLEPGENTEEHLEWLPLRTETQNFLRYSVDLVSQAMDRTIVHFSQVVELRREKARDLHFLAGMAGEALISNEMTKSVTEMIKVFIERAKEQLETG